MHRKLKELTNQSARDFIRGIRLKQAASLLKEKTSLFLRVAYAAQGSLTFHTSRIRSRSLWSFSYGI